MKKYLYVVILSIVFWSCDDTGPNSIVNEVPSVPEQVFPSDNLLCTNNAVAFKWSASTDPEGYPVTYQLQVSTQSNFSEIKHDIKDIVTTSHTITLEKGVAYYWRVKAVDAEWDASDYSNAFQFYTERVGVTNYLPFSPILVSPILDASLSGSSATLKWIGKDVDNDALVYDVYFGTVNPPLTKVGDNQAETTLNVDVTAGTDYYWSVLVNDQKGGKTWGQVWTFKTN